MHKLNISQAKELIRFNADMGEVTFIWGQFGVGKSDMMRQIAGENPDDMLVDIRLGQYESVDLRGMPDREAVGAAKNKTNLTVWDMPATLPFIGNPRFAHVKGRIWLFFDEANQATNSVSGCAYQITNDKCIGEHLLMSNVVIVMAGNREGVDKGVVNKQPLPLSNRVNHFELIVSTKEWISYQKSRGLLPALCYAFYEFRPALLNTYNPGDPKQLGVKTVATPRTTEKAWRVYASKTQLSPTVRAAIMAGWVGEGVAAEIESFAKVWEMVRDYLPEIRKHPESCRLPKQAYQDYAAKAGLTDMPADAGLGLQVAIAIAISGEMNIKTADNLYAFIKRLPPDFTIMAMQYALERKGNDELYESGAFIDYSHAYKQAFVR